jgi:2-polyprenyl-3-methyl-5-hydroxy-6-metoxy-1,4-benzoquinol methylase
MQAESRSGRSRWPRAGKAPALPESFPDSGLLEDLPPAELHRGLFHLLFGRDPAPDDPFVAELERGTTSPRQLMEWLIHSAEWSHSAPMTEFGPSLHYGRGVFIRSLPRARRILDIGGVALGVPYGALVLMGYPYAFKEIVIVDLPSEDRHELYQDDQSLTSVDVAGGRVSYRYHSMTDLSSYPAASFDMVYSGESIEHITRADAGHVLAEARRVLKPGGVLALDTPNAKLTRLQQDAYIDPDHKYEYRHAEMAAMLRGNGFVIERAMGINYGGTSVARGVFDPTELATKRGVFDDIENCYLLAYVCRRPRRPSARTGLAQAWWRVAGTQATPRRALGRARRMFS